MLLLHGGFGTVQDFASQTPKLAKHFKVVAFERLDTDTPLIPTSRLASL